MSALDILHSDISAAAQVVSITRHADPPDIAGLTAQAIKQHYDGLAGALRTMLEIEKRQHAAFVIGTEQYIADMLAEGDQVAAQTKERLTATKTRAEAIKGNGANAGGKNES